MSSLYFLSVLCFNVRDIPIRELEPKHKLGPIKWGKAPGKVVDTTKKPAEVFRAIDAWTSTDLGVNVQVDGPDEVSVWQVEGDYMDLLGTLKKQEINTSHTAGKVVCWTEE